MVAWGRILSIVVLSFLGVPVVNSVFVPVVNFLLKRHNTGLLRAHHIRLTTRTLIDTPEFDVLGTVIHQAIPTLPTAFHHATVVPATQPNSANTTDDIGDNVKQIEVTTIWKETLYQFRANSEP
jgi:hypothetical protein